VSDPAALRIRPATLGDAALLARLAAETFAAAFGPDNRPEDLALHLATHYSPDVFHRELSDPGCDALLAFVAEQPAGYAQLFDRTPPVDLGSGGRMLARFYLDPAWIGRGIAGPLMEASKASGRGRGARYLWLTVWQKNPRAIAFYEKCGFGIRGSTIFTVGTDPQEDWVMSAPL
jgi:GNAT superfamily N-acetyltransferase